MDRLTLEKYKKHFNFPPRTKFKGYVIHLPDREEFLAKYEESPCRNLWGWAPTPELAMTFKKLKRAKRIAYEYGKHDVEVYLLFDTPNQLFIYPVGEPIE